MSKILSLALQNQIIQGDCLEKMKDISDNSIDLIVTDPPFNTTDYIFESKLDDKIYQEWKRILKQNGWLFVFCPLEIGCKIIRSGFRKKFEYIWVKPTVIPATWNTKRPLTQHEIIRVFIKPELKKMSELFFDKESLKTEGKPYERRIKSTDVTGALNDYNRRLPLGKDGKKYDFHYKNKGLRSASTVLFYPNKNKFKKSERTLHPTQKPLGLIETITKGYCPPNGLVLDTFAGSGTTAIACLNTKRNYICIEKDEKYFEIMKNRITKHQNLITEETKR